MSWRRKALGPLSRLDEVNAIVAVANAFIAALNKKSRAEFEKHCYTSGGMALSAPAPAPLRFCTIDSFIERITSMRDEINERIWDPEVKVYELGNLATVWAPFRAKINGVVDHVGVNLFVMHKVNGLWKITGMADSCRLPTEQERKLD
ncbi:hypothetical protein M432DRAFT_629091 [Thermoascus aurantiacus ATCC 26904]